MTNDEAKRNYEEMLHDLAVTTASQYLEAMPGSDEQKNLADQLAIICKAKTDNDANMRELADQTLERLNKQHVETIERHKFIADVSWKAITISTAIFGLIATMKFEQSGMFMTRGGKKIASMVESLISIPKA